MASINSAYDEVFNQLLEEHGLMHLSKTMVLPQDFIEANMEVIKEDVWISLIRNQRHISTDFFYKFSLDMSIRVHVILLRRALSDVLKKISN